MEIYLGNRFSGISSSETCFRIIKNKAICFGTFESLSDRSKIKIAKDRFISKYMEDLAEKKVLLPDYISSDLFWNGVESGEIKLSKSRLRCDVKLAHADKSCCYFTGRIFMKTESRDLYAKWIVAKLTAMHAD